ncbi:alpha/beta hydrolase family protein [Pelagicoccus mobilis]|uniref:S9 family peptidase n=1 Tax=Pelagicoccus mobilis TaxID=415221 RepID=A0A934VS56_9BACT|nr:alpha/beta fold hydrolase [Pelagicoccus mobilis]MBK1878660.1 S9 family peptidase [Pelagicoccus mobilis]
MKYLSLIALAGCLCSVCFAANSNFKSLAKSLFAQPSVSDVRITPGNRGLSYIANKNGRSKLCVLDFESRRTYDTFIEGTPDVYDYYWIDRDNVIIFVQQLGNPIGAFTASYKLGRIAPTDFYRVYDTLPDKKRIYIAKDEDFDSKFNDLYQVNAISGSRKRIEKNDGSVIAWLTDKDGVTRIRYTIDENENDRYAYRSGPEDAWRDIPIHGHPLLVLFLNEPEQFVILIRRKGTDTFSVYKYDAASEQYTDTLLEHETYDILYTEIMHDPETEETYGFAYDLAKPATFWFDPTFAEIESQIDSLHPEAENQILGYNHDRNALVYHSFSDTRPSQWRLFSPANSTDELLLEHTIDFDTSQTQACEPITFPNRDGTLIHGYLTRTPNRGEPHAKTLLMIHGGPRARDRWGWDAEAQYFAALGYNVLKINYRGSDGYGVDYSPYSHFSSMQTSVRDTIDGAKWLIEQGIATKGKIGIYGSSFGGHVALSCAAEAPELFFASIGYAGVYDWPKHLDAEFKEYPVFAKLKFNTYYPGYEQEKEKWLANSAIARVDQITCPVYLLHGGSDDNVSQTQSRRMHKALKKAGKNSQLKIFSFNGHGLVLENNRVSFYSTLAQFLAKNAN